MQEVLTRVPLAPEKPCNLSVRLHRSPTPSPALSLCPFHWRVHLHNLRLACHRCVSRLCCLAASHSRTSVDVPCPSLSPSLRRAGTLSFPISRATSTVGQGTPRVPRTRRCEHWRGLPLSFQPVMCCVFAHIRSVLRPLRARNMVRYLPHPLHLRVLMPLSAVAAVAFASGMAATSAVIHLLSTGDHVISIDDVYGGTQRYFRRTVTPVSTAFCCYMCCSCTSYRWRPFVVSLCLRLRHERRAHD